MLTFQTHPQEVQEMQDIINRGVFFSITFLKKDNSIRYVNGRKHIHVSTSSPEENRGKFNRFDHNILLVWDNNKENPQTGKRGSYISAKLDRVLYFKAGDFVRDFTGENTQAVADAHLTPEQLQQIRQKIKLEETIGEEINNFLDEKKYGNGTPVKYYSLVWDKEGFRVEKYNRDSYIYVESAVKDAIKWAFEEKRGAWVELIGIDEKQDNVELIKIFEIDYNRIKKAQDKIDKFN